MAFYSLSEHFFNEHGSKDLNRELCMEVIDGIAVKPPPAMIRERSRGRHDPGDGPYVNRIAIGGKTLVEVPDSSKEYILQGSSVVVHTPEEWADYNARFYEDWTNCTYCELIVSDNQPKGWGYTLAVRSFTFMNGRPRYREYRARSYGFTEANAEALGLQLFNQYKGVDASVLPEGWYRRSRNLITGAKLTVAPMLSNQFLGPVDTLDADYVNRRIETGLASAFVDACDKLPSSSGMNNIANVADIISSLKSMSKGLTKIGSAADAWLAYRYSYNPTKSDIMAFSEFASRLAALPSSIKSNGFYRDGDWEYRVAIDVASPYLASLVSFGEKWGLALDAVNAWDLIPYSFIVDWFIPVSELLERWQSQSFAMQLQQTSWCSVRHEYVNEFGFNEIDYSRFLYDPHARFASVSRTSYGPKTSTIVKRAIDVLALFA